MGFFFFSSRRRHTRLQGDWSSDVCSSDLRKGWDIHRVEQLEDRVNIHEYQAKDLLRAEGVPIPAGEVATTADQAEAIARKIAGPVVVKAQVHAGGRGKAVGRKLAKTPQETPENASKILGIQIQ